MDFHWPEDGRIVEVDAPHHDRLASQTEDDRRDDLLTASGWTVTRIRRPGGG